MHDGHDDNANGLKHSHYHEDDAHGEQHAHEHGDSSGGHSHRHVHTEEENRAIVIRLSRAIGHLESVRRMVQDGRDCTEVLIQLSAVRSALNNAGSLILQNHIEQCIVEAVASGDNEAVADLNKAISKYLN